MKCMYAQTRPRFILSSQRVFGGMEFEPMLTPREKSPLPENFPRGSNPRRCGQRAQTLPTSYSGPRPSSDDSLPNPTVIPPSALYRKQFSGRHQCCVALLRFPTSKLRRRGLASTCYFPSFATFCGTARQSCVTAHVGSPGAGIMEADDRQVTTVFTVQPSFHHRHSTNPVS